MHLVPIPNDAIRDREKVSFKWCSLKCAELTMGAKERRCLYSGRFRQV